MRALRIHLKQSSANYRREETIDNKMTYPLPPFSTVIGAIHKACNFTEYQEMKLSIQGSYGSLGKEVYLDHCFLNSLQNDRGILVKMCNDSALSKGFVKVAAAKKSQGNDFRKGITIEVLNQELLDEYRRLKDLNDAIGDFKKSRLTPILNRIKDRKKCLSESRKNQGLSEEKRQRLSRREQKLKKLESTIKQQMKDYEEEHYQKPISYFRTLTTAPRYYEVLYDVDLIIHVSAADEILDCIYDHIGNLTSIGRSEDFVQLESCDFTELEEIDDYYRCEYSAYIQTSMLKAKGFDIFRHPNGKVTQGTRYLLNKNYTLSPDKRKRVFQKKLVVYLSEFAVYEPIPGVYIDKGEPSYIVNLI